LFFSRARTLRGDFAIIGFCTKPESLMTLFRRMPFSPCAIALALALSGCASAGPQQMEAGTLHLVPHQSVELAPGTTLTYDSVSDSRCPPDVKCIWAGKLSYQFTLNGPGASDTFSLGPDQLDYTSPALHGAHIVLDDKAIPPARAAQAAPEPHPVTLKVSSL
jgi:hypothetical protein